jgi:small subunit ribosomal protein S24e
MDVKITQQKDNALMARKDIRFQVAHAGETTPSRTQVRQLVAAQVGTKTENVVIETMETEYGIGRTAGIARAYKSVDEARKTERTHLLKRNALYVEKAKKGGAKEGDGAKKDEKAAAPAAKAPAAKKGA